MDVPSTAGGDGPGPGVQGNEVPDPAWPFPGNPHDHIGDRHHVVPKFYLDRFARAGRIAVLDRRTHKRHIASTKDTATERDFYTYIDVDGHLDGRVEQMLGHVEGEAASAIRNLTSVFRPELSVAERVALCWLLAVQLTRGKASRRGVEMFADMFVRLQLAGLHDEASARAFVERSGREPTTELVRSVVDTSTHLDEYEFVPDPNDHISTIVSTADAVMPYLVCRPWIVLHFPAHSLVTSDEPVGKYTGGDRDENRGIGVANAKQILFPLDHRRLLVLGPADAGLPATTHLDGEPSDAAFSNWLVSYNAYEFIFAHPDADPVLAQVPDRPLFGVDAAASSALNRYVEPPMRRRTQRRRAADGTRRR